MLFTPLWDQVPRYPREGRGGEGRGGGVVNRLGPVAPVSPRRRISRFFLGREGAIVLSELPKAPLGLRPQHHPLQQQILSQFMPETAPGYITLENRELFVN